MSLPHLRYRAVLTDPDGNFDRPQQAFANTRESIDEWAMMNFRKASPKAFVEIFETTERSIATVQSPKWKDAPVKL